MKQPEMWKPTKFEQVAGRWRGSRDSRELAISSRITADAAVRTYEVYLKKYVRGRLVDVGCGKVPLFGVYRDLVSESTTVDWAQSPHDVNHVDVVADLNFPTPLGPGQFETLVATSVIEHIREPAFFFSEVSRLLVPGGIAIISTPFLYPLHEQPHDYYRYTEHALHALCQSNGLDVVEITRFGGLPEVLGHLMGCLVKRPRLGALGVVSVLQLLLRLGFVRRLSAQSSERFPLGYTMAARKRSGVSERLSNDSAGGSKQGSRVGGPT